MNHWERTGTDGTNENHQFLYALGRGVNLGILILALHFHWFNLEKKLVNQYYLLYIIPIYLQHLLTSLESVRFPLIYYSFYSYFLLNNINKSKN